MENLKLAVYQNILNVGKEANMDELIEKYEGALYKYCFDKENNVIIDIHLLKLVIEAFEFYYMVINAKELEQINDEKIRQYQYEHCYEIKYKSDLELTKCDYIYLYSTMIIEKYEKEIVDENEFLFKKIIMISKKMKEYESQKEKIKRLS